MPASPACSSLLTINPSGEASSKAARLNRHRIDRDAGNTQIDLTLTARFGSNASYNIFLGTSPGVGKHDSRCVRVLRPAAYTIPH